MNATKIVRPQAKGMVTIPVEFREKLGITEDSILQAQLTSKGVLFVKMQVPQEEDFYSDAEIQSWIKADQLDAKTAQKIQSLLRS